jgi:hypothetical protein
VFSELNKTKKRWIWSNGQSVQINVELHKKEFNDLIRDYLKGRLQADDETAVLWIVTPLKINSLEATIINVNDRSIVNDITSFRRDCPHFISMIFDFKCSNDNAGNVVTRIENKEYAIQVALICGGFNQDEVLPFTHDITPFNPGMLGDFDCWDRFRQ